MLSTIAIDESSEEKVSGFQSVRWHNICSPKSRLAQGKKEGRTVAKRSLLPLAKASV
jgi:hypothetical protein